jgi:hypothetical protein
LRRCYTPLNVRLIRELDSVALEDDESVLPQGLDRFAIELGDVASSFRDEAQGLCAALPERSLEAALFSQGRVSLAA